VLGSSDWTTVPLVERIAVYGKGGIGKSVVATGLSTHFGKLGKKVLHVGCDPKRDSSLRLIGRMPDKTVVDLVGMEPGAVAANRLINEGRHGIHCIESGGPQPGLGCGGRGVARAVELLEEIELLEMGGYDAAIFDVLGDVVCGGFAAPLRQGFAEKVVIVVSEEPMALFAANNIAKAVVTYQSNHVALAGIVANLRTQEASSTLIEQFADRIGTRILVTIPRDPAIIAAERQCETVLDATPESPGARALDELGEVLTAVDTSKIPAPTPLSDEAFFELVR
jgi:nitrogenase iron protein NifH